MNTQKMTQEQKAVAYFNIRGIHSYENDGSVYIVTPDSNELHVLISTSEVIYRAELLDSAERYPRFCDETKKGIFVGYVFDEGDYICSTDEEVEKMCKEHGYDSREEAFEDGLYYYTEWEECDEDWWYEKDGDDWFEVSHGERNKVN